MFPVDRLLVRSLNISFIRTVLFFQVSFPFLLSFRLQGHCFVSEFLVTLSLTTSFWQELSPSQQSD